MREISKGFNPEVSGSLRPNGHKNSELREWEKNILVHLNNVNLVEKDDRKTPYVKFKLFKRDIYRLALVDTGNLVKGTLVSSEFWNVAGTLDKFQRTFFTMSAREKIRRLVDRCNTCLAKERSIQNKRGPLMPSTVGNVGEKVFIDLVSMSETVRKNRYLLTVQDAWFTRFASAYLICNKEASTVARVLILEHFSVFGLPNQIHSNNRTVFVNKLWAELFSELKILHTRTPLITPPLIL